jgi:CCR4-NOT transcription complex subunit 1
VEIYTKAKVSGGPPIYSFHAIDAYARLIVLLIRQYTEGSGNQAAVKVNLAKKILSVIMLVLVNSHETDRVNFNQRPLFRLFSSLFNDLNMYRKELGPIYFSILCGISNTLHAVNPSFLPGFTFAWVQLISHRFFMPKILEVEGQKVCSLWVMDRDGRFIRD